MPKMVLVTWRDHAQHRGEWDGDEPLKTMLFQSVGWQLAPRDGDDTVRIATSWDAETQQYSDVLALEPGTVEEVVPLRRDSPRNERKTGGPAEADPPVEGESFLDVRHARPT